MTIVVGYIPTPLGEAALASAIAEAGVRGSRLVVVNSTRADRLVDARGVLDPDVAALESRLRAAGVPFELRRFVSEELAADDVISVAEEVDAELLVIGLRHRSPVGKLVLGSTAQRILLGARCPVLAVKLRTAR